MKPIRTVRIGLAGCGTVGTGVYRIVVDRGDALAARTGLRFEIVRALVTDVAKPRDVALPATAYTANPAEFAATDMDMVVEVMGGTTTAREVVLTALRAGTPVVTANKALLAMHGAEVYAAVREGDTGLAFEASCAGGLPIIGALLHGLQANRTESIMGIFNSTCNFVLTRMLDAGMLFADAVAEAQRLGYAEADPTLDVSGADTAHKLTILASLAFGLNVSYDQLQVEGIEKLQLLDLKLALELGYGCKLLGIGRRIPVGTSGGSNTTEKLMLAVHPTLIPVDHPLAGMSGTSSGIRVIGDVVGETFFAGSGAGSLPTASAVVADMIDVADGVARRTFDQLRVFNDQTPAVAAVDPREVPVPFYVRFSVDPAYVTAGEVQSRWLETGIGTRTVRVFEENRAVVIVTEPEEERRLRSALHVIAASLHLTSDPVLLRIMHDD